MAEEKKSFHEEVAERIIAQLEKGTAPWLKPWRPGEVGLLPHNPVSGIRYKGVNSIILSTAGYEDPRWMTYNQAQAKGWQVKRGEKAMRIQYWKFSDTVGLKDEQGKPILDNDGKKVTETVHLERPKVFFSYVFNAAQIDGVPAQQPRELSWDPIVKAQNIVEASGARIVHDQRDRAFYSPREDTIHLPFRDLFPSADNYYATVLHELGHHSGHETRLNREIRNPFGSIEYAREELRAEIASMMLGDELGVGHDPGQHVAYIDSWIHLLRKDPKELFRAAKAAEEIMSYVIGLEQKKEQVRDMEQNVQESTIAREKTYLAVPYEDKDEAKQIARDNGFRILWDNGEKSWYAEKGANLAPLAKWLPENMTVRQAPALDPREEFAGVLKDAGLLVEGPPVMDGVLRRVPVLDGKAGGKDGAYVGHLDGHPSGYVQNFKTGFKVTWKAKGYHLSQADKEKILTEAKEKAAGRKAAREKQYEQKAEECRSRWEILSPAPSDHPYLERKGVTAHGIKQNENGELVVPVRDMDGRLWSLQRITEEGKLFEKDARKTGCFHVVDPNGELQKGGGIFIAEGYATAASIHEAIKKPVVAAFDSGNLETVATEFRKRYPDRDIFIMGDDDRHHDVNAGRAKAEEAAKSVRGKAIFPLFTPTETGKDFTDWNDLHRSRGLAAVKRQIEAALSLHKEKMKETAQVSMKREAKEIEPPQQKRGMGIAR